MKKGCMKVQVGRGSKEPAGSSSKDSVPKRRIFFKQQPSLLGRGTDAVDPKNGGERDRRKQRRQSIADSDSPPQGLKEVLDSLGISQIEDLDTIAEEPLSEAQIEAFQAVFEQLAPHSRGRIDAEELSHLLDTMDINISSQQVEAALQQADYDGNGEVRFQDFLSAMTDSQKFSRCLNAAEKPDRDPSQTVEESDSLFYKALNKMLAAGLIPNAAVGEIVRYYHKESLLHVWRAALQEDKHSHVIAFYAKGAHLVGLQPKQLMKYIEPQAQGESPYSKRPSLNVTPCACGVRRALRKPTPVSRLERLQSAKTWKTMEIEDHIRQLSVKYEGVETKEMITPVKVKVKLKVKDRERLTYDDIGQIRCKAKEGLSSYLSTLIQCKERDAWSSLDSLQSCFGLHGRKGFLDTFSTYSWSWSGCRDMLQAPAKPSPE